MFDNWRYRKSTKIDEKGKKKSNNSKINVKEIEAAFGDTSDIKYKQLSFKKEHLTLIYIESLVDYKMIDDSIISPIVHEGEKQNDNNNTTFSKIENGLLTHISTNVKSSFNDVIDDILNGNVCLIDSKIDKKAITFDVKKVEKRSITEPTSENIIKGSKEAFVEDIKTNLSLIRNRIRTPNLKIKEIDVGKEITTKVAVVYMSDRADKHILEELINRLNKIDTHKHLTLADLEEKIIDKKYSIFPQVIYSEIADKIIASVTEGKIGIVVDGYPTIYIIPAVFNMFFQTGQDYSANYAISTCLRMLRYLCIILTVLVPAFYVAVLTFHQEMIPTELSISIIESKQGDPFPVLIEVFFMLIAFEILIEASIRLPKTIGQTISIIGGLIVGEAAVNANFVSPSVVVVIAISGVSGFLMPNQDFSNALRICRLLFVIASGIAGLYGLTLAIVLLLYSLSTIESFGVPYFVPFTSNDQRNMFIDTIVRIPMDDMRNKARK